MQRFLILFSLVWIFSSCESKIVVSEIKSLPGYWDKNEVLEFKFSQLDSLKKYNLFFQLRNTNDYHYNNIFLIASIEFPHGKTIVDTLEYKMAKADGTWLGTGIGTVKENKLWYKENVSFFEEGDYTISILQAVRNNGEVHGVSQLQGITEVGYSIEEVEGK